MKTFVLNLHYSEQPLRQPAAWFVGGTDPDDWLAEVIGWGIPLVDLTLYVVPRSADDLHPLGALAVPAGDVKPATVGRAVPYGRIAGRIYLPVNAHLSPPAAESELAALAGDRFEAYAWHPAAGFIGFERGEGRRLAQFLEPPARHAGDWGRAQSGVTINSRLRAVLPADPPDVQVFLDQGRGDIGDRKDDLSQLPQLPGESSPGTLKNLGARAVAGAARAAQWLLKQLPKSASAPTWANKLQNWLGNVARSAAANFNLLSARERELRRLLNLLATDPDQGLKFALPLAGGDHRGLAPPSATLGPHHVNFNLDRLRGGGPADFWNIPPQIQLDLLREYRRLAERELRLGRHRRAAYIFAELVNDLAAAAAALVAGGHFREAAVLYRDRLKNPLEAARCLEQGRLWAEALAAFEELREYERAGDLARRIDQPQDAERLFRLAVTAALERRDHLSAARLLDQKLRVPDEALERLDRGWKSDHQSRQCVAETFRLLGRLGRHEEAAVKCERFTSSEFSPGQYRNFVDVLTEAARTYPNSLVRGTVADTVRVMAAARLKLSPREESQVLLEAVRRLAPEDRLLERDCQRFLGQPPRPPAAARAAPAGKMLQARLVQEIRLPRAEYVGADATDELYYVAGYSGDRRLHVVRGYWSNPASQASVDWRAPGGNPPLILVARQSFHTRSAPPHVIVHTVDQKVDRLPEREFPRDEYFGRIDRAGSPLWTTADTAAVADAGNGVTWALQWMQSGPLLAGYSAENVPLASQPVDLPLGFLPEVFAEAPPTIPVPMQVRESKFYIGLGNRLVIAHRGGPVDVVEMPWAIRGLTCSAPHTRRRLAVTFDSGGRVLWDDASDRHEEPFGMDLGSPVAGFLKLGWLIAASSTGCQIYSTSDRRVRLSAECEWPESTPISVLDTGTAHVFAVCFADGTMRIYRIS
jgi:hypothetical protein